MVRASHMQRLNAARKCRCRLVAGLILLSTLSVSLQIQSELAAQTAASVHPGAELVFSESPSVWFEAYSTLARVSPDGRWAIYAGGTGVRILDLMEKRDVPHQIWPGLSEVFWAAWGPKGTLLLAGTRKGKRGWYRNDRGGARLLPLPPRASPLWSPGWHPGGLFSRRNTGQCLRGRARQTSSIRDRGPRHHGNELAP